MSWEDDLFDVLDDLEQQAVALYDAERDAELADRSRAEYAHVTLASRLAASIGTEVSFEVRGLGSLHGTLARVATGWCLLSSGARDWVVPQPAVTAVTGASARSLPEVAWPAVARLGLGSALRRLAEAGERCVVHLVDGDLHEATVTRVGADFVELTTSSGRHLLVPFAALAAIRAQDPPVG